MKLVQVKEVRKMFCWHGLRSQNCTSYVLAFWAFKRKCVTMKLEKLTQKSQPDLIAFERQQ